jgi:hypothetical protein
MASHTRPRLSQGMHDAIILSVSLKHSRAFAHLLFLVANCPAYRDTTHRNKLNEMVLGYVVGG